MDESKVKAEAGDYQRMPKSSPDGDLRLNPHVRQSMYGNSTPFTKREVPIRQYGESETRISLAMGLIDGSTEAADYASKMLESVQAKRSTVHTLPPLKDSEYLYRKIEAARIRLEGEGFSGAEIDRKMTYDKAEGKRLRQEATAEEMSREVQGLQRLDLPEHDDLFNHRFHSPQAKIDVLLTHMENISKEKGLAWQLRMIRLVEEVTRLKAELSDTESKPEPDLPEPPPVIDFTTGDLEIPERFIIKDLDGFKFDPQTKFDGLKLPYDSCLFVLGTDLKAVVLATQEDEDVITLKLLSEQKSTIPWHATATLYARLKGDRAETKWIKTTRSLDKRLGMVSSVLAFIAGEQLNELQIETVITAPEGRDIPPPKPGFCYNVVHLTQGKKGKRSDWQGGTHASPREHKRRGYWWPGKNGPIWIKPTIVNKGVLGRVDKEYHVTKVEETKQ